MARIVRGYASKGETPMKVLAVLMIATGLLAGGASPRRAVNMIRRRPVRNFCPRCQRLVPPGMVPRANSVCMPDDWSVCGGIVESTAQKLWRILWGTAATPRWVWFLFGFGLAALLLTGCATMQAYQAEQARWQAKADQATRGLRVSQVMVILKGGQTSGQYIPLNRMIERGTESSA